MPALVDSNTGVVSHLLSEYSLKVIVPLPVASDSPEVVATSLTLAPTVTGEVAEVLIAGLAFVTLGGSQVSSDSRFCGWPLASPETARFLYEAEVAGVESAAFGTMPFATVTS